MTFGTSGYAMPFDFAHNRVYFEIDPRPYPMVVRENPFVITVEQVEERPPRLEDGATFQQICDWHVRRIEELVTETAKALQT